jgi:thiamine biosynthesis lipoprotein
VNSTEAKVWIVRILVATAIPGGLAAQAAQAHSSWIREQGSIDTMGSVMAVEAYGRNAKHVRAAISDALDEADRLDAMLSNYKYNSEWSRMNRLAASRPVHVSDELFALLEACQKYSRESDGTFDISVGPLMKVWGFYKGSGHLPSRTEVNAALRYVGYRKVILDRRAKTVRFAKQGVELDPGGIGKGYAVDRMAEILRREGVRTALISAGGSSIYAMGAPPRKKGWRIELKNPRGGSRPVGSIVLRDESISTSGNYEQFFYADGRLWSHIMDPRTGYPTEGMLSVSVIAPKTIDSEAWTKPYYILGRKWTAKHKKRGFRVFMCEDKTNAPCRWVQ